MSGLKKDILTEIESKFNLKSSCALKLICEFQRSTHLLEADRIIRCVIFLSDGTLKSLEATIKQAQIDPRDVILWAEYDNSNELKPDRIRDFNIPFN